MEAPASKKFRENDNSNREGLLPSNAPTSCATLNEEEDLPPTIPSLASHIFLTNLRDVRLLKVCRLVCRSWYIDATISLRALSAVYLLEGEAEFTEIRDLILERKFGPLENLPSPFENIQAGGRKFAEPSFVEMILLPNVKVTGLRFFLDDHLVLHLLGEVLAANQNNITELSIVSQVVWHEYCAKNAKWYERILARKESKPKALKSFVLRDQSWPCHHGHFLNSFISDCKLERMDLTIFDGKMLTRLLTQDIIKNLGDLSINVTEFGFPEEALAHLSKLKFFHLKAFRLYSRKLCNETSYLHQLFLFYESVSPFIKDFDTNFQICNIFELRFPNLEKINIRNSTILSGLNPDSFPALSKICVRVAEPLLTHLGNDVVPHHGVRSLEISVNGQDRDFLLFMSYMSRQFPKVCTLKVSGKFSSTTLPFIYESFPKVTTLALNGYCDFASFWGINGRRIETNENVPRQKSITDFNELESILFGSAFVVQPGMLTCCLSRLLPKLRRISFHWNQFLSAKLFQKSIDHLEKVRIFWAPKLQFQNEIAELSKLAPTVYLRRIENTGHSLHATRPIPIDDDFD